MWKYMYLYMNRSVCFSIHLVHVYECGGVLGLQLHVRTRNHGKLTMCPCAPGKKIVSNIQNHPMSHHSHFTATANNHNVITTKKMLL